ncbi:SAM-dependent methyltransferase [Streptomyces xanthochromogenes]|uniref:SAM-dependent methyltransferase n=1 Tax=Streptomyces xanthochromogenes TaxID=67384 RepID=UPI001E587B0E|nr:SAM-dependent methyltransferase [Streptomyces xanthochromogenes]
MLPRPGYQGAHHCPHCRDDQASGHEVPPPRHAARPRHDSAHGDSSSYRCTDSLPPPPHIQRLPAQTPQERLRADQLRWQTVAGTLLQARTRDQIARFFNGWQLLDPGLQPVLRWRPDPDEAHSTLTDAEAACYAGAAWKP